MWMPNSLGDAPEEASSGGDQFFMLFSRHPTPMWIADVDTLAITEVNDAALARWGYARNEVLDMTLREVLPPEGIEKLTAGDERPRRAARFSRTAAPAATGRMETAGNWVRRSRGD